MPPLLMFFKTSSTGSSGSQSSGSQASYGRAAQSCATSCLLGLELQNCVSVGVPE